MIPLVTSWQSQHKATTRPCESLPTCQYTSPYCPSAYCFFGRCAKSQCRELRIVVCQSPRNCAALPGTPCSGRCCRCSSSLPSSCGTLSQAPTRQRRHGISIPAWSSRSSLPPPRMDWRKTFPPEADSRHWVARFRHITGAPTRRTFRGGQQQSTTCRSRPKKVRSDKCGPDRRGTPWLTHQAWRESVFHRDVGPPHAASGMRHDDDCGEAFRMAADRSWKSEFSLQQAVCARFARAVEKENHGPPRSVVVFARNIYDVTVLSTINSDGNDSRTPSRPPAQVKRLGL